MMNVCLTCLMLNNDNLSHLGVLQPLVATQIPLFWLFFFVKKKRLQIKNMKIWKPVLDFCLNVIFKQFYHFALKIYSCSLSKIFFFFYKTLLFAVLPKNKHVRWNLISKMDCLVTSIPKMYTFIYIIVMV